MSGLTNYGNTCYANSVVQMLRYTKPVVKPLVYSIPTTKDGIENKPLKYFLDLLYQDSNPKKFLLELATFGFNPLVQHDAHEFFITMVDKLYESVDIKNPFEGEYTTTLTCKNGHKKSRKDSFICLSINGGINEGFIDLIEPEEVECKCEKCAEQTMMKRLDIEMADAVCFHFKRFNSDMKKLRYAVPIVEKWNKYELIGICNHSGSVQGGHYTATVKTDSGWVVANDESVKKIDALPKESRLPYLMVYVRNKRK
jgi:ubiquitin C-terminal hydrolase